MDPEQVTMYMEIGSRAFSDLSGEDGGIATALIKNRCLRAGYGLPKPKPTPVAGDPPTSLITGKNYVVTMPLRRRSQAVLTVKCDSFTKNNNIHATIVYGYGDRKYKRGKKIIVLRKDILCSAKED